LKISVDIVSKKNFNPKSIKTNNGAIIEYNRLRSLYRRDLQHLVGNNKKNINISDKNIYLRRQTTFDVSNIYSLISIE